MAGIARKPVADIHYTRYPMCCKDVGCVKSCPRLFKSLHEPGELRIVSLQRFKARPGQAQRTGNVQPETGFRPGAFRKTIFFPLTDGKKIQR